MATLDNIDLRGESRKPAAELESFGLPDLNPLVTVTLARDLDPKFNKHLLLAYEPFNERVKQIKTSLYLQRNRDGSSEEKRSFHDDPYELKSIPIQAVDFFGP